MEVLGYNSAKTVRQFPLSPRTIWRHQIDPLRLDLFEERPVCLEFDGETFHFSPLGSAVFVAQHNGTVYLAIVRAGLPNIGIAGTPGTRPHEVTKATRPHEISNIRRVDFADALAMFLNADAECGVCRPEDITIYGDSIILFRKNNRPFMGSMFEKVPLRVPTGPAINALFDMLGSFKPRVFGTAARLTFLRESVKQASCQVMAPSIEAISKLIAGDDVRILSLGFVNRPPVRGESR